MSASLVVGVLLGGSALVPSRSEAQPSSKPSDEARTRYDKGIKLYKDGAFEAALIEFQRAYELNPSYKILYNLGQVNRQINDFAGALRAYERYLKDGGGDVPATRRDEVEKELTELRSRVGKIEVIVDVAGAEILVDDASVGKSPLGRPLEVNSGKRKITVIVAGRTAQTRVITIAGAETQRLEIAVQEPAAPKPVPSSSALVAPTAVPTASTRPALTTSSAPETPPPKRSTPWVGWAITGTLAAGAVVTGVLALSASSDLKDKRTTFGSTHGDLDSARSRSVTLAAVTDVLTGAAIIAGGVSLYFTLRSPSPSSSTTGAGASTTTVRVGAAPGGILFDGSF